MSDVEQTGQPCDDCGSSDAKAYYADGSAYCFSCKKYTAGGSKGEKVEQEEPLPWEDNPQAEDGPLRRLPAKAVPSRGLQQDALDYYGVGVEVNTANGEAAKLEFPVYKDNKVTGLKTKVLASKDYFTSGDCKSPQLFGQHQAGDGGKLLVITEGEEDCMSAHQMLWSLGKKYNVVSLPFGGNIRAVKHNLEWIESFSSVILNLDGDKIGTETAREIGDLLTPGKVSVMTLPVKDANDFLLSKAGAQAYLNHLWKAKPYRPDGVVNLADSWDLMWSSETQKSIPYPWEGLNRKLYGMRPRELVTWTAGTGIGKSAVVREIEHWLLFHTEDNLGVLALEESVARTAWGIVSVEANLPLSIDEHRVGVDRDLIKQCFDRTMGTGRVFTLDHFGSTSEANLLNRVRYMIKGLGCKWIVLDHLSIVVSAMDEMGDERKAIDSIMTKLRQMCEETGAGIQLVSHLRRAGGDKGHEQGLEVSLSHLRGSQAIAQLSDAVIAMERNQQADDEKEANLTRLRVLKNRYAGLTGLAANLAYDRDTGRLVEIFDVEEYLAPTVEEAGV